MPKRPLPSTAADTYASDDGFVADDAPASGKNKNKKAKVGERDGGAGKGKDEAGGGYSVGKDGGEFWELSGKRRIQLSEYGGRRMVNIREYYEKEGEMLPGKKGISLTLPQFNTVISLLPHIESVLVGKGESVDRPDYSGIAAAAAAEEKEGGEDGDKDVDEEEVGRKGKTNFEETSDED